MIVGFMWRRKSGGSAECLWRPIDSLPHYFMDVVEVNPQAQNTTKTGKGDKLTGSFPQGSLYFSSFCCLFNVPIDSLTEKLEKDEE